MNIQDDILYFFIALVEIFISAISLEKLLIIELLFSLIFIFET